MGKRKRRSSDPGGFWRQEIGGAPMWFLAVAVVGIIAAGAVGVSAMLSNPAPEARAQQPVPTFTYTDTTPTPEAPPITLPADPQLLIVGDSYTQGYAAEPETSNGWAYLSTAQLGWPNLIDGVGGTGFTYAGGTDNNGEGTFATRIQRIIDQDAFTPNLVVLQGGHNDWRVTPEELTTSIVDTVNLVRGAWPDAQIVVVGPVAGSGEFMATVSDTMATASSQAGVPYISPLGEGWFDASAFGTLIIEDGTHLNNEGHAVFADRFVNDYRALFGTVG